MSGKKSRNKGQVYERKIRNWFKAGDWTVIDSNRSGYDGDDMRVLEVPGLSIEVKNQQKLILSGWLDQARDQCQPGDWPVVIHHRKGQGDPAGDYVTMDLETFEKMLQYVADR